jgi:hypothetical protein
VSVNIDDRPVQNVTVRERMWFIDVIVGCTVAVLFALAVWQKVPTPAVEGIWLPAAVIGTLLARWHATGRPPQLPHPSHPATGKGKLPELTAAMSHRR